MATKKRYKYWNGPKGAYDKEQVAEYEALTGSRVRNPQGYTGNRSVEYVAPGRTKVYYPDRTLEIQFKESPKKFRGKVMRALEGRPVYEKDKYGNKQVRQREKGNQIIVAKYVRDNVRRANVEDLKGEERARKEREAEKIRQAKARAKEREAERKAKERAKAREAQMRAKERAKAKSSGSKTRRRRATDKQVQDSLARSQAKARGMNSKIPNGFLPAPEPKSEPAPKSRWDVNFDEYF